MTAIKIWIEQTFKIPETTLVHSSLYDAVVRACVCDGFILKQCVSKLGIDYGSKGTRL